MTYALINPPARSGGPYTSVKNMGRTGVVRGINANTNRAPGVVRSPAATASPAGRSYSAGVLERSRQSAVANARLGTLAKALRGAARGVAAVAAVEAAMRMAGVIGPVYADRNSQKLFRQGGPKAAVYMNTAVPPFWMTYQSFRQSTYESTEAALPATAIGGSIGQVGLPLSNPFGFYGLYGLDFPTALVPCPLDLVIPPYGRANWQTAPLEAPALQPGYYGKPDQEYEFGPSRHAQQNSAIRFNRSVSVQIKGQTVSIRRDIPPVRPAKGIKERKIKLPMFMAMAISSITETADLINILFNAATNNSKIRGLSLHDKTRWLFLEGGISQLDLNAFLKAYLANQAQDFAIGKLSRRINRNFRHGGENGKGLYGWNPNTNPLPTRMN